MSLDRFVSAQAVSSLIEDGELSLELTDLDNAYACFNEAVRQANRSSQSSSIALWGERTLERVYAHFHALDERYSDLVLARIGSARTGAIIKPDFASIFERIYEQQSILVPEELEPRARRIVELTDR